ncbi:MAG: M23 family metallopeptidase [Novosphingobium sp.]|nr:M23 family metallopeptidase [Novosphingobium sp.]
MGSSAAALAGLALGTDAAGAAALPSHVTIDPASRLTQGGWLRGKVLPGVKALAFAGTPLPFASDGSFIIAFDRDATATASLVATLADGRMVARDLVIAPRAWQIEHINVARKPGGVTDEDYLRLRKAELARIGAARSRETGASGWRQDFIRPAPGRFSGRFGSQRIYKGEPAAYHSGLDIAGGAGTTYVAPADGVVILAAADRAFSLEGHLLMIDHGMGLNSAFLHGSALLVKEGDRVRQGDPIGRIGSTGRATGPHLHWSVKWRDSRIDPLLLLHAPA